MDGVIRVLLVDDDPLVRSALTLMLGGQSDIEVVGEAPDGAAGLAQVTEHAPDVVLMDIRMPGMDGVEGTRLLKERYPRIKVIVLTTFDDDEYVFGALKNGASGYLLKGSSVSELSKAIQIVHEGGAMLNPEIASKAIQQFSSMAKGTASLQADQRGEAELSHGERQMIRAVGRGLSNKEIAGELCLSEGTVRNTISGILSKLDLRDRTQLAIWAVQTGAVDRLL